MTVITESGTPSEGGERTRWSVGILGAGQISTNLHLPTLLSLPDVSVAWIADAHSERSSEQARAFSIEAIPLSALSARLPEVNIVLLAIPYGAREAYFDMLRGRPEACVYVEKPFARTASEHRRLCQDFGDWRIACGLQRRAWGPIQLLKRIVQEEAFGPLEAVRVGHGSAGNVKGSAYSSNLELAGGGILFEVGVHLLDAALFITNSSSVTVERGRMELFEGFDIHTEARLALGTASGRLVPMELIVSGLQDTIEGLEFEFDRFSVVFSLRDGKLLLRPHAKNQASYELSGSVSPFARTSFQTCAAFWTAFLHALSTRTPNFASASDSLVTTQALEALYALGGSAPPLPGAGTRRISP